MRYALFVLLVALAVPQVLLADFNFMFPRTRTFSEIASPQESEVASGRRRYVGRDESLNFSEDDSYDTRQMRSGGFLQYVSDFQWRDFRVSDTDAALGGNAYVSLWGIEASIFALWDGNDRLEASNPYLIDYRLSYTFKVLNSINTVSYTLQDWSNVEGKVGFKGQGFGTTDPKEFEDTSNEIQLSSYWFNEILQRGSANVFLGQDVWIWLDGPGVRSMTSVGIMATKMGEGWVPNGARMQGGVIAQSDYHTTDSSLTAINALAEAFWDLRQFPTPFPLMITAGIEYYLPVDKDPADNLLFFLRIEAVF